MPNVSSTIRVDIKEHAKLMELAIAVEQFLGRKDTEALYVLAKANQAYQDTINGIKPRNAPDPWKSGGIRSQSSDPPTKAHSSVQSENQ